MVRGSTGAIPLEAIAHQIINAERAKAQIPSLVSTYQDFTIDDAYRVQAVLTRIYGKSRVPTGWKVGLSNRALWEQLGATEPFFGRLYADMEIPDGGTLSLSELSSPRLEAEIAFLIGRRLEGPGVSVPHVLAATEGVMAALEIIDHRVKPVNVLDFIADNGASARYVLGKRLLSPRRLNLPLTGMALTCNGEIVATAAGAAVLGHPAAGVAWLCNKLAQFELALEPGDIVLAGSLSLIPISRGQVISAHFDKLEAVSVVLGD